MKVVISKSSGGHLISISERVPVSIRDGISTVALNTGSEPMLNVEALGGITLPIATYNSPLGSQCVIYKYPGCPYGSQ
jgi:hypothetical protein